MEGYCVDADRSESFAFVFDSHSFVFHDCIAKFTIIGDPGDQEYFFNIACSIIRALEIYVDLCQSG